MDYEFGDRLMAIGGQMVPASSGEWIVSLNPATEEPIGRAPAGTADDVHRAVAAAEKAQPEWAAKSIWERGALLRKVAAEIRARADEVRKIEAADSGNTIANLNGDMHKASNHFEYFAGLATEMKGETVPATPRGLHMTVREPYGVVGRIVPFNHPFMFAAANIAAPLVAGNAVILKSPETSPLTASIVGEVCNKVLPPGVVNIVSGYGIPVGDAIARHPKVRRIGFTGSIRTGLAIQRAAAETGVKHVSLELGGKNPLIICEDADLEMAVTGAVAGMNFAWAGQSCGSTSRILVHESLYDRAVEMAKAKLEAIRVGDPLDPAAQMGPVNSAAHYQRVMGHIATGRVDGAKLVTGGDRPKGEIFKRGYWVAPTLFANVTMDHRIGREEVFGPVMSFFKWNDFDAAVEIANATEYGLTASIYTRDIGRALGAAKRFQSGVVAVNHTTMHFIGLPFGGYKNSGVGGEECLDELLSYTQTKSIHIAL
ncbi:MAG: aldehyde dehydrogenase family protein [Rhodobacteraceae bacterium]|nr:aldehyde dehydrogenase family protein [Paracoccaceae bacterium]